jgi:hypothetical protein
MISLVPESTQGPAGYVSYGGQFGSYLPIAYAIGDILSFLDASTTTHLLLKVPMTRSTSRVRSVTIAPL